MQPLSLANFLPTYKLKAKNDSDPYLHAKNHREQLQIEGFEERIEIDEYNVARRYQKTSKKESLEFRVKKGCYFTLND